MKQKTAIIIGAGYGGIALANLLGKVGYSVDVYEKNASPGGRIAVRNEAGFTFDLGPSWYLMPEVFEQYYSIFGESSAKRLDLLRLMPGYKVFFSHHEPLVIQGDAERDASVFEAIEPGAGQKLGQYVHRSSETYELAVTHFLYNNTWRVRDLLKWEILRKSPRMMSLLIRTLDAHVGRTFRDIRLRQILEYHSVFLGSSPFEAPGIYSLMSHLDFKSGIYYPRRGMPSLVTDLLALGEGYPIAYHYHAAVEQILVEDGSAVGVRLENGDVKRADVVISNADLHFTETVLLPESSRSFPEAYWQTRQPGPGAFLLSLGVEGSLPQLHHHNLYFVDDWRGNFDAIYHDKVIPEHASLYVCNPTKTDPSLAPAGHENLFILMPIPAGVDLDEAQLQALADKTVAVLAQAIGEPELSSRITQRSLFGPRDFEQQYNAWEYNAFAGESHLLSQSILFRTPNKSKKVKNLYYVGSGTVPGIGLPMCLIGAQLVFKRLVNISRPGPLTGDDVS